MAKSHSNRIPAVGYIRMSTDKQEDSPDRQRNDIQTLADRSGYRIVKWYEDHGLTGTESANRPEFLRLLKDAHNGKFQAILVSEQSRMSREDIFDVVLHWRLLRDAGVKIVTYQRGELDFNNLGGVITAIVDQYGAREESIKLAQRVVSGQRRRVEQGRRIGGIVYGYDREVYDEAGNFVRRVHFQERFRKPAAWRTNMVPSKDKAAVNGVRWAFDAIRKGHTAGYVAREFNRRGLTTTWGNKFNVGSTMGILRNPAYAGVLRVGHYRQGKFCSLGEGEVIVVEDAHEPLVSREVFDEVGRILDSRTGQRSVESFRYLLSGLITCQHCGNRIYGVRRARRDRDGRAEFYYHCSRSMANRKVDPNCPHPSFQQDKVERFVLDTIRDRLLDERAERRIREAIVRANSRQTDDSRHDQKRLRELRAKIAKGTENLALASREDYQAIAKLLAQWREQEAKIAERIDRRRNELEPLPEALKVIAKFTDIKKRLAQADRAKLAAAIHVTVKSITLGTREVTEGEITHLERFGELQFHEILCPKPIVIPDQAIGPRKPWREFADFARELGRPVHLRDFATLVKSGDLSLASQHAKKAVRAGLLRRLGTYKGWVAT